MTSILGLTANDNHLREVGERYKQALELGLTDVALVRGVEQFLQLDCFTFFLNSSAPIEEIEKLMQAKSLSHCFKALYGYPHTKVEVLQHLKAHAEGQPLCFLGDAWADYQAALSAGVPFIGVDTQNAATFTKVDFPVIRDFHNHDEVIRLIESYA